MQCEYCVHMTTRKSHRHSCCLQVIYLEEGRIAAQGTYEQVRENERFVSLLQEFNSGGLNGTSDSKAGSIQVHNHLRLEETSHIPDGVSNYLSSTLLLRLMRQGDNEANLLAGDGPGSPHSNISAAELDARYAELVDANPDDTTAGVQVTCLVHQSTHQSSRKIRPALNGMAH